MERVRDSMKKDLLNGLTEEQIAKVKTCKNHEELLELAKKEGVTLTEEQLAVVSGGGACSVVSDIGDYINPYDCPRCGSNNLKDKGTYYICQSCGYKIENYN